MPKHVEIGRESNRTKEIVPFEYLWRALPPSPHRKPLPTNFAKEKNWDEFDWKLRYCNPISVANVFFCFGFIRVRAHSYTVWLVGDFWLSKWTAAVAMRKFGSNLFCVWFFDDVVRGWNLNLRETLWIYDWRNHIKMLRKLCDEYGKNNWAICNCEMKKLCLFCLCYCNEIKFDWFCLCDRLG